MIEGGKALILGKKRRLGKKVEEITIGEKLKLTEKIADKDILLYLGLTNDGNPRISMILRHKQFTKANCSM